jgi:hypothetical protein
LNGAHAVKHQTAKFIWEATTKSEVAKMFGKRASVEKVDEDIQSAIWVLSCIDENPIMTYRGIASRTAITEAEARKLVGSRRELFRPGVRASQLETWKTKMRTGRGLPAWILEMPDAKERQKAIDDLSQNDVFRNQFRVESGAPKCSIETINWGLTHLDLIRRSASTAREEKLKRWGTVIIPMGALAVALMAQASQWKTSNDQRELKFYEVSFKPKQENYTTFMSSFNAAVLACTSADEQTALLQINRMESAYFALDPFFDDETRKSIFLKFVEFSRLCETEARKPALLGSDAKDVNREAYQKMILELASFKQFFRENIFKSLFGKNVT